MHNKVGVVHDIRRYQRDEFEHCPTVYDVAYAQVKQDMVNKRRVERQSASHKPAAEFDNFGSDFSIEADCPENIRTTASATSAHIRRGPRVLRERGPGRDCKRLGRLLSLMCVTRSYRESFVSRYDTKPYCLACNFKCHWMRQTSILSTVLPFTEREGVWDNLTSDGNICSFLEKKTTVDYNCFPLSFAKKTIRVASLEEWQKSYSEGSAGGITKCFFPGVEEAYRILSRIQLTPFLAQALTGQDGFA
ncbi:hypothetical protein EVAR_28991_1 [Eumeta japonica]|uniref:Uncharacterized protein n=1 Tax=Eumeta variegata TaxID=151549 RepID=A0A4C1W2H3_EUMVA|nr:hypothetical protein EVAR_28991_1 [Eumeta japonica]